MSLNNIALTTMAKETGIHGLHMKWDCSVIRRCSYVHSENFAIDFCMVFVTLRWVGYDPEEHQRVLEEYQKMEMVSESFCEQRNRTSKLFLSSHSHLMNLLASSTASTHHGVKFFFSFI